MKRTGMANTFTRQRIRGTASQLEKELNRLQCAGKLHEVWTLEVNANPEDIQLGIELYKVSNPAGDNLIYEVISGYTAKITQREEDLRTQQKYLATDFCVPINGDAERSVAIIQKAK